MIDEPGGEINLQLFCRVVQIVSIVSPFYFLLRNFVEQCRIEQIVTQSSSSSHIHIVEQHNCDKFLHLVMPIFEIYRKFYYKNVPFVCFYL